MTHQDIEIKYDLSASNSNELIEIEIGNIHLPTGKIIVSDPFYTSDATPFFRTVAEGIYPVKIYVAKIEEDHFRIAFAKIKFRNEIATHWILAVSEAMAMEELVKMKDDEYCGFPVDAGLACFLDESTNEIYLKKMDSFFKSDKDRNYYDELLAEEFLQYSSQNPYSRDIGDWNNHIVEKEIGLNVVMFASGWGDGYYPTYWGYNPNRETVELTIDFLVSIEDDEA